MVYSHIDDACYIPLSPDYRKLAPREMVMPDKSLTLELYHHTVTCLLLLHGMSASQPAAYISCSIAIAVRPDYG